MLSHYWEEVTSTADTHERVCGQLGCGLSYSWVCRGWSVCLLRVVDVGGCVAKIECTL